MITLNVFFDYSRIFFAVIDRNRKGLKLLDIGSTSVPVDLSQEVVDDSNKAIAELKSSLHEIGHNIEELNVIVSNKYASSTQIPFTDDSSSDLIQLINLEIRQHYPESIDLNFLKKLYLIESKTSKSKMYLLILIKEEILRRVNKLLNFTGLSVNYFTTPLIAAMNCAEYNYPEISHLNRLLIGFSDNFLEVSVNRDCVLSHYNLIDNNNTQNLIPEFDAHIKNLNNTGILTRAGYAYGNGLTKSSLDSLNEKNTNINGSYNRLNAFRYVKTNLSDEYKDYCFKTAHIYPPVVGACLHGYDKSIAFTE